LRIETTSKAVRSGLAEMVRAATPATSGVALDVPPKRSVTPLASPVVVVTPRPRTVIRQYSCELLVGAEIMIPVP
jgi:hypothetical protein